MVPLRPCLVWLLFGCCAALRFHALGHLWSQSGKLGHLAPRRSHDCMVRSACVEHTSENWKWKWTLLKNENLQKGQLEKGKFGNDDSGKEHSEKDNSEQEKTENGQL